MVRERGFDISDGVVVERERVEVLMEVSDDLGVIVEYLVELGQEEGRDQLEVMGQHPYLASHVESFILKVVGLTVRSNVSWSPLTKTLHMEVTFIIIIIIISSRVMETSDL